MRSYASKPSSDAGLRPIQDFLPQVVDLVSYRSGRAPRRDATATGGDEVDRAARALPARSHGGAPATAKQIPEACTGVPLTGRRRAPRGVPSGTAVPLGGEGTPSREVVARPADAGAPAKPFAWWSTPAQRALRAHSPAPIAPPARRPFSRPDSHPESASQKAAIHPFTGSNTPYESHE